MELDLVKSDFEDINTPFNYNITGKPIHQGLTNKQFAFKNDCPVSRCLKRHNFTFDEVEVYTVYNKGSIVLTLNGSLENIEKIRKEVLEKGTSTISITTWII